MGIMKRFLMNYEEPIWSLSMSKLVSFNSIEEIFFSSLASSD